MQEQQNVPVQIRLSLQSENHKLNWWLYNNTGVINIHTKKTITPCFHDITNQHNVSIGEWRLLDKNIRCHSNFPFTSYINRKYRNVSSCQLSLFVGVSSTIKFFGGIKNNYFNLLLRFIYYFFIIIMGCK